MHAHALVSVCVWGGWCGFLPLQQLEEEGLWTVRVKNEIDIYKYSPNKHGHFLREKKSAPASPCLFLNESMLLITLVYFF